MTTVVLSDINKSKRRFPGLNISTFVNHQFYIDYKYRLFGLMGTGVELFTHGYDHAGREVGGSNPGRGTIVGGGFHPTKQLARFSPPNMSYIVNLFRIGPRGEAVNYRPYSSPPI